MVEPSTAADIGTSTITLPAWLGILLLIIGASEPFVAAWLTSRATIRQVEATRETDRETHAREVTRSNRELIMLAAELLRNDDRLSQSQGRAMLRGLAQMRLSPDDAIFVQSLVRPLSERTLSAGREVEETDGDEVQYYIELDETEEEHGNGEAAGQGES